MDGCGYQGHSIRALGLLNYKHGALLPYLCETGSGSPHFRCRKYKNKKVAFVRDMNIHVHINYGWYVPTAC